MSGYTSGDTQGGLAHSKPVEWAVRLLGALSAISLAVVLLVLRSDTVLGQLALLRAHPDLAGKAALAGELTVESTEEQRRAGLGSLTPDEMARFQQLNEAYKAKFGFPFVLAVRNATKGVILGAFARRVNNTAAAELAEGIAQVHKIAWMRLRGLVTPNPTGFLTCHVLDTARGCPAAGMAVTWAEKQVVWVSCRSQ